MALITCPECGKEVSDQAPVCPNCGYPLSLSQPDAPPPETPPSFQTPTAETKARNRKILFGIAAAVVAVVLTCALVYAASFVQEPQRSNSVHNNAESIPVSLPFWERDQNEVLNAICQRIENQTIYKTDDMKVVEKNTDGELVYCVSVNGKITHTMISFTENPDTGEQDLSVVCTRANEDDSLLAAEVACAAVLCECDTKGNFPTLEDGDVALLGMMESIDGKDIDGNRVTNIIDGVQYQLLSLITYYPSRTMIFKAEIPPEK